MALAGRNYKDSFFRALFKDEGAALRMYCAITGRDMGGCGEVEMKTLDEAMLHGYRNDVAFVVGGSLIVLAEHQSTPSPNMPARMWQYLLLLYQAGCGFGRALYGERLVRLPKPEFYLLCNGGGPCPARSRLRLSDAFTGMGAGERPRLELVVDVVDISLGANPEVLGRSEELMGYAVLVDKVRRKEAGGMARPDAVREAAGECVAEGVLAGFLQKHRDEVYSMLSFAYDEKLAREVAREEGWEDGLEEGLEKGREEGLEKGLERGLEKGLKKGREEGLKLGALTMARNLRESKLLPLEEIARLAGLTVEEVRGLQ